MVDVFVDDIRNALKHRSWFSALALALVLPDMCGMAEDPAMGVAGRYISWYDRFVTPMMKDDNVKADRPYMSGEMVYNLRNTFLHQGAPTINTGKVKEAVNQIDEFALSLDDDNPIHGMTLTCSFEDVSYKFMTVDVTNLCKKICDAAMSYYEDNREKFGFNFKIIPPKELCDPPKISDKPMESDPVVDIINDKLKNSGKNIRLRGSMLQQLQNVDTETIAKNRVNESKTTTSVSLTFMAKGAVHKPEGIVEAEKKKTAPDKKEQSVRCFYGQAFKDKKYKEKKELIIAAMIASETKTQLNSALTKVMPGEDVKEVLKRLKPFIKDWPG